MNICGGDQNPNIRIFEPGVLTDGNRTYLVLDNQKDKLPHQGEELIYIRPKDLTVDIPLTKIKDSFINIDKNIEMTITAISKVPYFPVFISYPYIGTYFYNMSPDAAYSWDATNNVFSIYNVNRYENGNVNMLFPDKYTIATDKNEVDEVMNIIKDSFIFEVPRSDHAALECNVLSYEESEDIGAVWTIQFETRNIIDSEFNIIVYAGFDIEVVDEHKRIYRIKFNNEMVSLLHVSALTIDEVPLILVVSGLRRMLTPFLLDISTTTDDKGVSKDIYTYTERNMVMQPLSNASYPPYINKSFQLFKLMYDNIIVGPTIVATPKADGCIITAEPFEIKDIEGRDCCKLFIHQYTEIIYHTGPGLPIWDVEGYEEDTSVKDTDVVKLENKYFIFPLLPEFYGTGNPSVGVPKTWTTIATTYDWFEKANMMKMVIPRTKYAAINHLVL